MRDKGIKPICGVNFNSVKDISDNSESGKLTLYAKNFEGYRNLTMLVSKSHIEGRIRSIPHLKLEWLKDIQIDTWIAEQQIDYLQYDDRPT